MRSSYIVIAVVSVFTILLHLCRFFDKTFVSVEVNVNNINLTSCQGDHKGWIHNPFLYESVFAWTRISVAQFVPGVLMVLFVTLMIKSLRDTTKATKRMKLNDSNLQSDRRQLSLLVAIVAIIVFCVEVSSGIFLSFSSWEMSTGQEIVSYQSLKTATTAFDLVLYEGGSIYNGNTLITPPTKALECYAICGTQDQGLTFLMVYKTLFYVSYLL